MWTYSDPMTTKTDVTWVDRRTAADQLGVCLRTLHRYMNAGLINFERDPMNGRVRLDPDSFRPTVRMSARRGGDA